MSQTDCDQSRKLACETQNSRMTLIFCNHKSASSAHICTPKAAVQQPNSSSHRLLHPLMEVSDEILP